MLSVLNDTQYFQTLKYLPILWLCVKAYLDCFKGKNLTFFGQYHEFDLDVKNVANIFVKAFR